MDDEEEPCITVKRGSYLKGEFNNSKNANRTPILSFLYEGHEQAEEKKAEGENKEKEP